MDQNLLREQLARLHEELKVAPRLEPGAAELLGEIMGDIKRLLEHDAPAAVATPTSAPSLPDRLEFLAARFEGQHPTLAASSRRLIDLLGKVGI